MLCEFSDRFEHDEPLLNFGGSYYTSILETYSGEKIFFHNFESLDIFMCMLLWVTLIIGITIKLAYMSILSGLLLLKEIEGKQPIF